MEGHWVLCGKIFASQFALRCLPLVTVILFKVFIFFDIKVFFISILTLDNLLKMFSNARTKKAVVKLQRSYSEYKDPIKHTFHSWALILKTEKLTDFFIFILFSFPFSSTHAPRHKLKVTLTAFVAALRHSGSSAYGYKRVDNILEKHILCCDILELEHR